MKFSGYSTPKPKRMEPHLVNKSREDNLADIIPQARFELQAPLAIEQQIPRQSRPILAEALISGIVPHSFEPVPDGGEELVKVGFVFPVVELAA
jgi:hypothetical protein